jgi:hypothetical protein
MSAAVMLPDQVMPDAEHIDLQALYNESNIAAVLDERGGAWVSMPIHPRCI